RDAGRGAGESEAAVEHYAAVDHYAGCGIERVRDQFDRAGAARAAGPAPSGAADAVGCHGEVAQAARSHRAGSRIDHREPRQAGAARAADRAVSAAAERTDRYLAERERAVGQFNGGVEPGARSAASV